MSRKIPKIIHYCWFGNKELPNLVLNCIESWKKYLPEYEIMFWNESNFDIQLLNYTKEAYENKKFAFVSDVCRVYVLKKYGGVYLDSDVEMIKPLPLEMLNHNAFSGFEDNNSIPTGIMASEKNGAWATEMYNYYKDKHFVNSDGTLDLTTNVTIITNLMKEKIIFNNTFQEVVDFICFYPSDVFCPKSHKTGKITITNNTLCIHHFAGSWQTNSFKNKSKIVRLLINTLGEKNYRKMKNIIGI